MSDMYGNDLQSLVEGMIRGPGVDRRGNPGQVNTAEQNRETTLFKKMMDILFNPELGIMAEANGIPGAMDYSQLHEPQQQRPLPQTPMLESYGNSQEPFHQELMNLIQSGAPRTTINTAIRNAGLDELTAGDLIKDAEAMMGEQSSLRESEAWQQSQPAQLSPLEQKYRDANLPLPTERYDRNFFDPMGAERDADTRQMEQDSNSADDLLQRVLQMRSQSAGMANAGDGARDGNFPGQGSPIEGEAPITQAWWQAQRAPGAISDFGDSIGQHIGLGATGGRLADGLSGLFSKPKPQETTGRVGNTGGGPSQSRWQRGREAPLRKIAGSETMTDRLRERSASAKRATREAQVSSNAQRMGANNSAWLMEKRGRAPTGDALMARNLMARMMGLS